MALFEAGVRVFVIHGRVFLVVDELVNGRYCLAHDHLAVVVDLALADHDLLLLLFLLLFRELVRDVSEKQLVLEGVDNHLVVSHFFLLFGSTLVVDLFYLVVKIVKTFVVLKSILVIDRSILLSARMFGNVV